VQSHRVHFARKLLDETKLPISEVALSSGFNSIRRFNDAMRRSFGTTPTDLRLAGSKSRLKSANGALSLRLPFRPPYDWDSIIRFLGARAIPGVESATESSYRRTFSIAGMTGTMEIRPSKNDHSLNLKLTASDTKGLNRIVERARRMRSAGPRRPETR